MNQISFTCSNNHPFKVPAKFAGKRAKCPKCGEVVTIPQVSTVNPTSQIISQSDDSRKRSRKRLRKEFKKTEHDEPALWAQLGAKFLVCVFGFAFFWGPIKMLWGLAFNAGDTAVVMYIYILIMGAFLFVKPAVAIAMLAVGVVFCLVMCAFTFASEIFLILVGVILLLLLVGFVTFFVTFLVGNPKARWPAFACVGLFIFCFTAYSFYVTFDRHARIASLERRIDRNTESMRREWDRAIGRRYHR